MDIRSQFTNRYKKDLSTEYIRTKVARRKSISQKENRHNEFKKSRGLSLADVNISIVKECELPSLEEVAEISVSKGNEKADGCKIKDKMLNERRELLLRFKEEKQLRKLKEQREKASRGIFKCGIYKPDDTLAPVVSSQITSKAKPKEKPLPPTATRVTRSMAKVEPTVKKTTRPQQTMATVFNSSKNTSERSIPKGRGLSATAKKPDKETKVLTAPLATRAAALTGSKLPSRNTTVSRPQKNIIKEKTNQTINQQAETVEKSIAVSKPILEEDVTPAVLKDDAMRNLEDLKKERKPSFAPQNFTFQPLDGLAPFKFQPRTPPSMPNDATSCFTWSPMRSERNAAILDIPESLPHEDCERVLDQMPSVEQSPKPDSSELQMDPHSSKTEEKECTNEECPVISDSVSPETHESVTETAPNENVPAAPAEEPKHDVTYFRNILKSEILRLTAMCTQWEEKFEIDIPEEAKDLIRTTVGQTRLLIAERFKQFEGLVDNCEFKRGEKETTCTDLEGFWDMVYFQIEDVTNKFANLNKLEENAWQQSTVQTKKVVRKKVVAGPSAKPNQGDNGKAAARSRLAAIKAALKNKGKKEEAVLETASSECIMQVDKVVFEAGFFRIESPAKVVNSLRKSNRFSQTPKSIIKLQECLENPVTDVLSTAEDTKVNSPVRKILFDTEKESVQESCQMAADVDNTEAECVSHVTSLEEKYLVPVQCLSLEPEECFVVGEIYSLKDGSEVSHCVSATIVDSLVDDVFMRSPDKVLQPITMAETPVLCADKEVKNSSSPLDFLGSSTPSHQTEVNCCPLKFDSVVAIDDLIVFSPADK